jgi:hypothetical protein
VKAETTTRALRDLVRDFHAGEILLPQFQRDYVWKTGKIRNLLDSLLRGFPIGGFYLWRPNTGMRDPKAKAYGEAKIAPEFKGYLIDGQQRLTSLEAAYSLYSAADKRGAELRCFLDLAGREVGRGKNTRVFVSYAGKKSVARRVDAGDPTLIPLAHLFEGPNQDLRQKTGDAVKLLPGWDAKRVDLAMTRFDRACQMLNQPVPCTTVYDISDQEAVEVFARLNKGGSTLRQGDVRAAELARGPAVNVLKRMRDFASQEAPQRLGFGFSFAFRALVVFHRESAQFITLKPDWITAPGPHGRSLAESWRVTERAVGEAIEFLDNRMGWSRRALLPSTNALIVLATAFDRADFKMDAETERLYRRWLCLTALRGVFQGSVETTINRFARAVRDTREHPARALVDALKRDEGRPIRADELNRPAQMWGPATQVMHAWLVSRAATDWLTDDTVDSLARSGGIGMPAGDLTVHHLFPRKLLVGLTENTDIANNPANYALLSRATNSELGDRRPDEVLTNLTSEQRKRAAVQYFGEAAGDRLKPESFSEFCHWRAQRLVEALNEHLGINAKR